MSMKDRIIQGLGSEPAREGSEPWPPLPDTPRVPARPAHHSESVRLTIGDGFRLGVGLAIVAGLSWLLFIAVAAIIAGMQRGRW